MQFFGVSIGDRQVRLPRKAVRWVRAGVNSLRQLKDTPMLWQGGFAALQGMIQGWLAGSQGVALAIAGILLIVSACCSQVTGEVGRSLFHNLYYGGM